MFAYLQVSPPIASRSPRRARTSSSLHPNRHSEIEHLTGVKVWHEFRDPVHGFIKVTTQERAVIDSMLVQRLRHIHQLSLSYLVYPGGTHKRFEHSLGVMDLAGRVFDVVTNQDNLTDDIRELVPEVTLRDNLPYWRTVVRMAALLHDVGHLPFSHGAEHELLPDGYNHERLTEELVESDHLKPLLMELTPPIRAEVVAKIAIGPAKSNATFSPWESILSEIVTDDAFGVDRIDYLLRDSLHTGVAYGRFDHLRLIESLRILAYRADDHEEPIPGIGVVAGGLEAAESLLLARYFMFSTVYYHPVRLMYDNHLQDFLSEWLPGGRFSVDLSEHLALTDLEVLAAIRTNAFRPDSPGYIHARRILMREHFRHLYQSDPSDIELNMHPGSAIYKAATERYGAGAVKRRRIRARGGEVDFPVRGLDGRVGSSTSMSEILSNLAPISVDSVFIDPDRYSDATSWLANTRQIILQTYNDEEEQT